MQRWLKTKLIALLLTAGGIQSYAIGDPVPTVDKEAIRKQLDNQLLKERHVFVKNQGQWGEDIRYRAFSGRSSVFFYDNSMVFSMRRSKSEGSESTTLNQSKFAKAPHEELEMEFLAWEWEFVGANDTRCLMAEEMVKSDYNYFRGSTQSKRDEKYRKLIYQELYNQTDLIIYTTESGHFKYDLKLEAGAKPEDINFRIKGVDQLSINEDGDLVLHTAWGEFKEKAPFTYQHDGDKLLEIPSAYVLKDDQTIGFELGEYDPSKPVIIDPIQVDWSTYFYGEGKSVNSFNSFAYTWVYDVDIDDDDHVYVTGVTNDSFVAAFNSFDTAFSGGFWDAFVCKMSPAGDSILRFTYIGGDGWEYAFNVAVNKDQEPVIAGFTYSSSGFPITEGAFDTTPNGMWYKGFITKLNREMDSLIFSTYFGGQYYNIIYEMELDEDGNLYVVGGTTSDDFPVTSNAWQSNYGGGGSTWGWSNGGDGFFSKLSADGKRLLYSTYIGGNEFDRIYDMHLDTSGEVYLCGLTKSTNFTTTAGSRFTFKSAGNVQGEDGFMMKFDKSLNTLVYSNIMGGSGDDRFESIYVNENGEAYLGGYSGSSDFPTTFRAYQKQNQGGIDHVVVKVRKEGVSLLYSTYVGGGGNDNFTSWGWFQSNIKVAANTKDEVIICGISNSFDYPTTSDAFQRNNYSLNNSFWNPSLVIAKLDMYGEKLVYGSYYGGSNYDYPSAVLVKRTSCVSNIVVGGFTRSSDYPVTPNAYKTTAASNNAWWSGFVSKFRDTLRTEPIDLGPDQLQCDRVGIVLDALNQGSDTRWNTGKTSRTLAVESPGMYWVEATYGCDTVRDTMEVFLEYSPTVPILGNDTTFCDNFPLLTLDAKNDTIDASFLWNNADTTGEIEVDQEGKYWVRISTENCGSATDTLRLNLLNTPDISQVKDSIFCDSVQWSINVGQTNNDESYRWSTNDSLNNVVLKDTGTYWLTITNLCGTDSADFKLSMLKTPKAQLPHDSVFCDQVNWVLQSGLPDNDEEYQWLDVSRQVSFFNRTSSHTIDTSGIFELQISNQCGISSDSVVVGLLYSPSAQLPQDSIFCDEINLLLQSGLQNNEESYLWQDNSTLPSYLVSEEGIYYVTISNRCGADSDSIEFQKKLSPTFNLPEDSTFCDLINWTIEVPFADPEAVYTWNNGESGAQININTPGVYRLSLSNDCGEYIDSMAVGLLKTPEANIPEDEKVFCDFVRPFTLSSNQDSDNSENVIWGDGFTGPEREIQTEGVYLFSLTNKCGTSSDSLLVRVSPSPVVDLGQDTILCGNFSVLLDAGNPGLTYLWYPDGQITQQINARKQTTYSVTVTNTDGCTGEDDYTIGSNCVSHVNIPDAFSPNNDGLNDVFMPTLVNYEKFEMAIFNRWGEKIFESFDPNIGWDGTYKGESLNAGQYTYVIRFITTENGEFQNFSGVLFLMK